MKIQVSFAFAFGLLMPPLVDGGFKFNNRRNLLDEEGTGRKLSDHPVTEQCSAQEYDLVLAATSVPEPHVSFLAVPKTKKSDDISNDVCPTLFIHSVWIKDDTKDWLEKVVIDVVNDDIDTFVKEGGEFLPLGAFPLKEITNSFDLAEIDNHKVYDVVTNNCGSLLINMGRNLGINPSDRKILKISSFVARNLSKGLSGRDAIIENMSKSEQGMAIIENNDDADSVIEELVVSYIAHN